jgi:hypothetical protein
LQFECSVTTSPPLGGERSNQRLSVPTLICHSGTSMGYITSAYPIVHTGKGAPRTRLENSPSMEMLLISNYQEINLAKRS